MCRPGTRELPERRPFVRVVEQILDRDSERFGIARGHAERRNWTYARRLAVPEDWTLSVAAVPKLVFGWSCRT